MYLDLESVAVDVLILPLPETTSSMLCPCRLYLPPEATNPGHGLYAFIGHQPKPGTVAIPPCILPSPLHPFSISSFPHALQPLLKHVQQLLKIKMLSLKSFNGWYLCLVENTDLSETASSSSGAEEMSEVGEHSVGGTSILVVDHDFFGLYN